MNKVDISEQNRRLLMQDLILSRMKLKGHSDGGFSLLELLVVVVIIGILAAIALPSFLNQANKARESEAKTYVGAINNAQNIRLIEESDFGTMQQLGNPIPVSTQWYDYAVVVNPRVSATITATPKVAALNPVSGLVVIQPSGTTASALCPGTLTPSIGCPQQ